MKKHYPMIPLLAAVIIQLAVLSCKGPLNDDAKNIYIEHNEREYVPLTDFLEDIRFIPIESSQEHLLGDINKIRKSGEYIYVGDYERIFKCDGSGKIVRAYHHRGRGPGEYSSISDFRVVGDNLLILSSGTGKLLCYDTDDNFIGSTELSNVAEIGVLNDSTLIMYHAPFSPGPKFSAYSFPAMEKLGEFGEITPGRASYLHFIGYDGFSSYNGKLLYGDMISGEIVELSREGAEVRYSFDLYGKNPPENFLNSTYADVKDFMDRFNDMGYLSGAGGFVESDRSLLLTVRGESGLRGCFYDKENKSAVQFASVSLAEGLEPLWLDFISLGGGGELAVAISPLEFMDESGKLLTDIAGPLTEESNPVICVAKLK